MPLLVLTCPLPWKTERYPYRESWRRTQVVCWEGKLALSGWEKSTGWLLSYISVSKWVQRINMVMMFGRCRINCCSVTMADKFREITEKWGCLEIWGKDPWNLILLTFKKKKWRQTEVGSPSSLKEHRLITDLRIGGWQKDGS